MHRECAVPGRPGSGNQPGLRRGIFHPAIWRLFTKKDGEGWAPDVDHGFPLQQRGLQPIGEGFAGVEAKNPVASSGLQIGPRRGLLFEREDTRSIFPGDSHGGVARAVIYDDDLVTGPQRFEGTAQAQSVIFRVQECCDRGHGKANAVEECTRISLRWRGLPNPHRFHDQMKHRVPLSSRAKRGIRILAVRPVPGTAGRNPDPSLRSG